MSEERDDSVDREHISSIDHQDYMIKLRGVSQSSSKEDIKKFLHPSRVIDIYLLDEHSASNECFAELESEIDVKDALKKSGLYLDKKHIEIFRSTIHEYNFNNKHKSTISWREPVIRMGGLPFSCTMADVQNFFEKIEIARNGIYITRDMSDKALGDGFVAFVNMDNAYKAIDIYDDKHIQHRYIKLVPSSYDEAKRKIMDDARSNARQFIGDEDDDANNRNTQNNCYNRNSRSQSRQRSRSPRSNQLQRELRRRRSASRSPPSRSYTSSKNSSQRTHNNYRHRSRSRSPVHSSSRKDEHLVKIRGMPYTVVEDDIRKFFPSSCQPIRIEILQDRRMKRPNGDAYVYFSSLEEVNEAMKCDRKYMGSRYVELYFDSPRYASLSFRRKPRDTLPHRTSRSPSKSRKHRYSRSRSDSSS